MTNINIAFCRTLLAAAHRDVKEFAPDTNLRDACVWSSGRHQWEFHGPDKFYWHGRADNAFHARYRGWVAVAQGEGRERILLTARSLGLRRRANSRGEKASRAFPETIRTCPLLS
jgi:hypothetical protein